MFEYSSNLKAITQKIVNISTKKFNNALDLIDRKEEKREKGVRKEDKNGERMWKSLS